MRFIHDERNIAAMAYLSDRLDVAKGSCISWAYQTHGRWCFACLLKLAVKRLPERRRLHCTPEPPITFPFWFVPDGHQSAEHKTIDHGAVAVLRYENGAAPTGHIEHSGNN